MKNSEQPAFSCITAENVGGKEYSGLTKREYFAIMAMQSIIAWKSDKIYHTDKETVCRDSVIMADELLKQLEK